MRCDSATLTRFGQRCLRSREAADFGREGASDAGGTDIPVDLAALGRSGVGVAWLYEGVTSVIINDPSSYAGLGHSDIDNGHLAPG